MSESAGLSIDLRRELQGRQLVKLLTADPLNGGGPAEASRFLSSLRNSNDALPVAIGAMQLLPDLRSKQLLVNNDLQQALAATRDFVGLCAVVLACWCAYGHEFLFLSKHFYLSCPFCRSISS